MRYHRKHGRLTTPRRMSSLLLLCAGLVSSSAWLQAQVPSEIGQVHPLPNQDVDSLTTPVSVIFTGDTPRIDEQNFYIYGNQTGLYPGTVIYEPEIRKASFYADIPYKVGGVPWDIQQVAGRRCGADFEADDARRGDLPLLGSIGGCER